MRSCNLSKIVANFMLHAHIDIFLSKWSTYNYSRGRDRDSPAVPGRSSRSSTTAAPSAFRRCRRSTRSGSSGGRTWRTTSRTRRRGGGGGRGSGRCTRQTTSVSVVMSSSARILLIRQSALFNLRRSSGYGAALSTIIDYNYHIIIGGNQFSTEGLVGRRPGVRAFQGVSCYGRRCAESECLLFTPFTAPTEFRVFCGFFTRLGVGSGKAAAVVGQNLLRQLQPRTGKETLLPQRPRQLFEVNSISQLSDVQVQ